MDYLPWIAVALLPLSYWLQVYRIVKHKEVRDLSLPSYILMAIGFTLLGWEAFDTDATIFLVKQTMVLLPVIATIILIIVNRQNEWHDDDDKICKCGNELEPHWKHCADCGLRVKPFLKEMEDASNLSNHCATSGKLCDNGPKACTKECGRC